MKEVVQAAGVPTAGYGALGPPKRAVAFLRKLPPPTSSPH